MSGHLSTPRLLVALAVLVGVWSVANGEGIRLGETEFFVQHLRTDVPEFARAKEAAKAGNLTEAKRLFAGYVRRTLKPEVLNREWIGKKYEKKQMRRLKAAAEETMDYKLSSCGTPIHFKDHKIDWECNPTYNGYREWTWQLSRHPFWTTLAAYYTATGDERAARVWVEQIRSWFRQCTTPEANVGSYQTKAWRTIETGIRMNGCWERQLHAFLRSPALDDDFFCEFFRSVWEHGWRLRTHPTRGNWLVIEESGMLCLNLVFPFFVETDDWRQFALDNLEREFTRQVYPDGFQYELSTGYHGVVITCYNDVFNLYRTLDIPPPDFIRNGLRNMYTVLMTVMRPDGRTPDLNDGGKLNVATWMERALMFFPERTDFAYLAANRQSGKPPAFTTTCLPYAGAAVFRTGWDAQAVWAYFDGGPFGTGHQHEDKLNFLLSAYGRNMLVEGGNFLYDSSEMRKYVLSTRSHNTIRFDALDQNRRRGYKWDEADLAKKADLTFRAGKDCDWAAAKYDEGYGRKKSAFTHERKVVFVKAMPKTTPFFLVIDRMTAPDAKPHDWEAIWHLDGGDLALNDHGWTAAFGGPSLVAFVSDAAAKVADLKGQKQPYWQGWLPIWAAGDHEHRAVPTPVVRGSLSGVRRNVTVLYPVPEKGACPLVAVVASTDPADTTLVLRFADGTEQSFDEAKLSRD